MQDGRILRPSIPAKNIILMPRNTICLWLDGAARGVATDDEATFTDNEVTATFRAISRQYLGTSTPRHDPRHGPPS
jgi:hypothetical protein